MTQMHGATARQPASPGAALLPGEDLFRKIVDSVRDHAILVLDKDGLVLSWNAGAQHVKGYRADEVIGRHFSIFYTADAISCGWPDYELDAAARHGHFDDEGWRVRKDGTRFWAGVAITALRDRDGNLCGYSTITRDLSERKAYEEELRQSEERFRQLVTGLKDHAVFRLGLDGRIASWNSGAQTITGYDAGEVIGRNFEMFFIREDVASGRPQAELEAAGSNGRFEDEGWRVRKDGSVFRASATLTALYDAQGDLCGFASVACDLTDRKSDAALQPGQPAAAAPAVDDAAAR